jgi:AraC-like DNA-binding protein
VRVEYVELEPCAALRGRVRYWRLSGTADAGGFEPVLPDGCVELVVHLGEPFWREHAESDQAERQPRALLAGPSTRPVRLRPGGHADVIGCHIEPGAGRGLVGMPLGELADELPELGEVAGALARDLTDELASPRRGERWTDVLDRRLTRALDGPARSTRPARIEALVARLRARGGRVPIAALADSAGLSTRQLERLFHEHVGLGPKVFARLVRFQRALGLVRANGRASLAAVAARAGYFDQAHLVRDFRRFAGAPPSAFRTSEHALIDHFLRREC